MNAQRFQEILHDARGRLTPVIANAELLVSDEWSTAEVKEMAADVLAAGREVLALLDLLAAGGEVVLRETWWRRALRRLWPRRTP